MRSVGEADAAGDHQLDVMRAAADLLTAGAAQLADAITDPARGRRQPTVAAAVIARTAHVAMAARRRQGVPTEKQPRSDEEPFVHGFCQAPVRASAIAYRREAAHQRLFEFLRGLGGHIGRRPVSHGRKVRRGGGDVHMRIAQARHHHALADVDPLRLGRWQRLADRGNLAVFDQNMAIVQQLAAARIQHARIAQYHLLHHCSSLAPLNEVPRCHRSYRHWRQKAPSALNQARLTGCVRN